MSNPINFVTEQALLRRIKRALAKDQQTVRCCRENSRSFRDLGRYYLLDLYFNQVIATHVDLETLGRELEVLGGSETIE
jgi:hypothetical protein